VASRKDQLHSYQFLLQRVISALVMRETDPAQAPLRRGTGAVFTGIMISVVVAAGFGVVGLVTHVGKDRWRADDGTVVVEKETGAVYVFSGGTLTPTLNYASALLLSAHSPPAVHTVTRRALAGVPRGLPVGIADAPDALPRRSELVRGPWTLCSQPGADDSEGSPPSSAPPPTTTTLVVGAAAEGGRPLGEAALLATDPSADPSSDPASDPSAAATWLVWHGHRYRLAETALASLFGRQAAVVDVGTAWLDALPEGEEIEPIVVPGWGAPVAWAPQWRVGYLLVDRVAAGEQYYLVLGDGLAPVTPLQRQIIVDQYPVAPTEVSTAEIGRAPKSSQLRRDAPPSALPPAETPELAGAPPTGAVCATSAGATAVPEVAVGGVPPAGAHGVPTSSRTAAGISLADRVVVPPGRAALVRAVSAPRSPVGSFHIVTDTGRQFAVPSEQVLAMLGFSAADAVTMPDGLLDRIPTGPTLDPAAATEPAGVGGERP
jgi:type VII secretion protein EccB